MNELRTFRSAATTGGRGYTLIELVIVIALLGLAGALLVPNLVDLTGMKAQAAVRQVIADLSFAQSDALAHQEYRRVHFYDDGRGYCLVRVNEDNYSLPFVDLEPDYVVDPLGTAGNMGNYIIDFSRDERYESVSLSNVTIDGISLGMGGVDLVYDPLGGTIRLTGFPGAGGNIDVSAGDDTFRIGLAPFTGKMTVQEM
jgi:prepilin-type N-terminal cleavage/methylation domain-containing protein